MKKNEAFDALKWMVVPISTSEKNSNLHPLLLWSLKQEPLL